MNIIDKPNHRSSHTAITIRGGGIIFTFSVLLVPVFSEFHYYYFLAGLLIISVVSFLDDVNPLSSKVRILFQLVAVGLLLYQLSNMALPIYLTLCLAIGIIGVINAVNFMDGINGITGAYALITLSSLWYINTFVIEFTINNLIITAIIGVVVFNYFNFRPRALCFAGDVGSVSIAFIIIFLIGQLIFKSSDWIYILLLLIYGLDTSTTMIFRILRKENILEPHRSHFYQFLANEKKKSHLFVASSYSIAQMLINVFVVIFLPHSVLALFFCLLVGVCIFVGLRFFTEGKTKLL